MELLKRHKNKMIVILCTLAYFVGYISRKSFAVVMVNMINTPGVISKETAGLVGTALFIFYGVGQLISGVLGDKLPPKLLMTIGLMVSAICNFTLPIIGNEYLMIPIWAINGFAQALLWPPIVKILSENLSHEKYVTANLIVTCGAHLSTVLLYVLAPLCISYMSYEAVFHSATLITIFVGIIFFILMNKLFDENTDTPQSLIKKEPTKPETASGLNSAKKSIFSVFGSAGVFFIFFCIIAMGFMRDGIESWLPTLYCQVFGRSDEEGILVSVLLPIFSIISLFAVRTIHKAKIFNNEACGSAILFGIAIVLCIPLMFLINSTDPVARVFCLILTALVCALMHSCNFLLISCLPGRFASLGRSSTVGGVCNACTYIGASISSYGIALISNNGWSYTIIAFIAICGVGVVFALLALKKYTAFLKESIKN